MKKVVLTAIDRDGLDFTVTNIELLVKDIMTIEDVKKAMRLACTKYCKTEEGKKVFIGNCHCFNYGDFLTYVPNTICMKYGIKKEEFITSSGLVNFDELLVDESEICEEE